ncbi:MAG: hypothetical protein ACFE95_13310, partial [Candidatus Hodarchaeota archaeon]
VVKINNDDYSVNFSTRIGGSEFDGAATVGVDRDQNIVVGGAAYSFDFPTTANTFSTHRIYWDGFVAIFSPDGQTAQFITILGGGEHDFINDMVIIESNDTHDTHILVTGQTRSIDFPTLKGVQLNYAFLTAHSFAQPFDCFFTIITVERPQPTTTTEIPGFEVLFALLAIAFLKISQKQMKRKK